MKVEQQRHEVHRSRNPSPGSDSDRTATPAPRFQDVDTHETGSLAPLTGSNVNKEKQPQHSDDIFELAEDDPARPANWTRRKKIGTTLLLALTTLSSTFASSSYTAAQTQIMNEYGVGREITILGVSLFIAGYIVGPIFFAPLSEVYGRRVAILIPYFIFICFNAATGASKDIQSIVITRFFGGVFGSAPVSNTSGGLADIWNQRERSFAILMYSYAVEAGPNLGPIVGNAISSNTSWRWIQWTVTMFTGAIFVLDYFCLPETRLQTITTDRAAKIRQKTKNWALHSQHEEEDMRFGKFLERQLKRPLVMLFTEPVLLVFCVYNAFAYSLVYLLFESFPIVFEDHRGWTPFEASLPFLAVFTGVILAGPVMAIYNVYFFEPRAEKYGRVFPEARLPPMVLGGITLPIAFFIFGWTNNVTPVAQIIAAVMLGFSYLLIFQSGLNYIIDAYEEYVASAVAANTFSRSILAAAFPLVARPLFNNLTVPWASTLLGCVSALLACVPIAFIVFGKNLRKIRNATNGTK